jgi:hypothetical protein
MRLGGQFKISPTFLFGSGYAGLGFDRHHVGHKVTRPAQPVRIAFCVVGLNSGGGIPQDRNSLEWSCAVLRRRDAIPGAASKFSPLLLQLRPRYGSALFKMVRRHTPQQNPGLPGQDLNGFYLKLVTPS